MKYTKPCIFAFLMVIAGYGCKLDLTNPNAPSDKEILNTREGMITLSIGMKQYYSASAYEALSVLTVAPTTREVKGVATFTNVLEMEAGGTALPAFNGSILALWSRMLRAMEMADDIIDRAPVVLPAEDPIRPGILAHAYLFKAMTLGALATGFEQFPLLTDKTGKAVFSGRQDGILNALSLLNDAATLLNNYTPPAEFNSRVIGSRFNLLNCINAYRARYNMMAGKYAEAITAANLVPLDIPSEFSYDGSRSVNPLFSQLSTTRSYICRDNFGLPAGWVETADGRLAFYYKDAPIPNGSDVLRNYKGFATSNASPIPVYLPDEMSLIKAEAFLRQDMIPSAVIEINKVRTQSGGDIFGVNANLPPYAGAMTKDDLLLEVYKQRCMELYLSGLRLEDSRRFGRTAPPANVNPVPLTYERNRNFYPYPDQERLNNPNVPPDPAI